MILLCVGNLHPFNRLVRAVDMWAINNPGTKIFAQIGQTEFSPDNIDSIKDFPTDEAREEKFKMADLLVCDLSIDLLLLASKNQLPVLALPRLSIFGEESGIAQTNLAEHLLSDDFIRIARDEAELQTMLSLPRKPLNSTADNKPNSLKNNLIQTIREAG
ncbi:MAG TPA: hypothetical protein ENK61_03925 [Devosia sp.]|nr:hypothetical protein [Devosia sp.]